MWRILTDWLSPAGPAVVSGTTRDLSAHLQRLLDSNGSGSLIVEVLGVEDGFLQFTASSDVIEIDYPLITATQIRREEALRQAFAAVGLTPYETKGSTGERFLDCDTPADAVHAAMLVGRLLESPFQIDSSTELRFIGNDLPPLHSCAARPARLFTGWTTLEYSRIVRAL